MKILWSIFKWNFKRFFCTPIESEWLTEERLQNNSFCANAIIGIVRQRGRNWLLPVNLTLFLLGLFFLIADDYIQIHALSFVVHIMAVTIACTFLILKFDAWKLNDDKNILKLIYIFCMSFTGGYASITYFFLIIYENMVAYGTWGGI